MTNLTKLAERSLHVALGTGDFLLDKARQLGRKSGEVAERRRKDYAEWYSQMATRGEKLATKVQRSKPAKRVGENAKQAQRQLKGAVTSVRKALGAEESKPRTSSSSRSTKKAS